MIKNKEKTYVRLAAGGFALLTALGIYFSAKSIGNNQNITKKIEDCIDDIKLSEEYIEHINALEKATYDAYKSGAFNAQEYSDRIEYISSEDYIYEHGNEFLDEEVCSELENLNEDLHSSTAASCLSILGTSCVGGGAVASALINVSDFNSKDEREM